MKKLALVLLIGSLGFLGLTGCDYKTTSEACFDHGGTRSYDGYANTVVCEDGYTEGEVYPDGN